MAEYNPLKHYDYEKINYTSDGAADGEYSALGGRNNHSVR